MPTISPAEKAARNAQNLLAVMQKQTVKTPMNPASNRHLTSSKQLAGIFQSLNIQNDVENPSKSPRVGQSKGPSSTPGIIPRVPDALSLRVVNEKWASEPTSRTKCFLPQAATHRHPTRTKNVTAQNQSSFAGAAIKHWFELQDACEKHACVVLDPIAGKPQNCKNSHKNPTARKSWGGAMSKELASFSQETDGVTKGIDCLFFMTHEQIMDMPKDRTVTHTGIVVDCQPQKKDPHQARMTADGNLIDCPGEVTTRTADMATSKFFGTAQCPQKMHGVARLTSLISILQPRLIALSMCACQLAQSQMNS